MKCVNRVTLLGTVGREPESKVLPSGSTVTNLSLATSERYKDQQGQQQEKTEWHNLTAYGKLAEVCRDYVHKGSKLYVEGRLTTRSWDKDGSKVYRSEIVMAEVSILESKTAKQEAKPEPEQEPIDAADIPF